MAFGGVVHSVKECNVGRKQKRRRMYAALGVRKKRAFKMDPNGPRLAWSGRSANKLGQTGEGFQRSLESRRDRSSQKATRSARSKKRGHRIERLWSRLHHVMPRGAVDVHVEECGAQGRAGKIENLGAVRRFRRFAARDGFNNAVFNRDHRTFDQSVSVPESCCSKDRAHEFDYCRRVIGAPLGSHVYKGKMTASFVLQRCKACGRCILLSSNYALSGLHDLLLGRDLFCWPARRPNTRSSYQQTIDGAYSRRATKDQQPAHVDGDFA